MLSNPSPLTNRSEVGGLFQNIFFAKNWMICPDLYMKLIFTKHPSSWVWCGGQFTKVFFLVICMKSPELYITHV